MPFRESRRRAAGRVVATLAVVGLFVIPYKRTQAKIKFREKIEALRAKLKKVGCRVTALDDAIAEESGAFTMEALVKMDASPFIAGNGNWEIICGDGSPPAVGRLEIDGGTQAHSLE